MSINPTDIIIAGAVLSCTFILWQVHKELNPYLPTEETKSPINHINAKYEIYN